MMKKEAIKLTIIRRLYDNKLRDQQQKDREKKKLQMEINKIRESSSLLGKDSKDNILEVHESVDNYVESGWDTKERMIEDKIDPKSVENRDTIEEILTDDLPPLEIMMNIEEESFVEGFVVVEKHMDEYDDNFFGKFVSLLETLKGALISS